MTLDRLTTDAARASQGDAAPYLLVPYAFGQDLDGDFAAQARLVREVRLCPASGSQAGYNAVVRDGPLAHPRPGPRWGAL
jgi:hypothetical protein